MATRSRRARRENLRSLRTLDEAEAPNFEAFGSAAPTRPEKVCMTGEELAPTEPTNDTPLPEEEVKGLVSHGRVSETVRRAGGECRRLP